MSDMKCPFCGEKLKPYYAFGIDLYSCSNLTCKGTYKEAVDEVWQELISTCKALGVAVDALKSAKARLELINNSKFANLNNVLQIQSQCEILKINEALEQITALTKGAKNE